MIQSKKKRRVVCIKLEILLKWKNHMLAPIKSTGKKANRWEITRVGADIKIKCSNCDHVVMMGRYDFDRK